MAEITAALVKELREMTGAGMMECKKALVEAEGELEKAVDVLRTRGLAAVAKKAGRATDEGTVLALVSECGHDGALVELNCETDFVGMNEKFRAYAEKIAKAVLANKPADLEALKASEIEGETVEAVRRYPHPGRKHPALPLCFCRAARRRCCFLHSWRWQDRRFG